MLSSWTSDVLKKYVTVFILFQASGDTVMYQDMRASTHLNEMPPRNGQVRFLSLF